MNESITGRKYCNTIVISIVLSIVLFQIRDPFFFSGILSMIILSFQIEKGKKIHLNYFDLILFLIWIYDVLLAFYSINASCRFQNLKISTISISFYFIVRFICCNELRIKKLLTICIILIGLQLALSIISFILFENAVIKAGFSHLYNFRFLFKPIGFANNEWGSLLILYMGFILLYRKIIGNRFVYFFLLLSALFCIITTFSRGTYISFLVIFILLGGYIVINKMLHRSATLYTLILMLSVTVISFTFIDDIKEVVKFNRTVSQQRSTNARVESVYTIYSLLKKYPILGAGSGNYTLVINQFSTSEDDNVDFTTYAPNAFVQLVGEKGCLGILLWVLLLFFFIYLALKKENKKRDIIIILITLIAYLIKENTFSIFWRDVSAQLLVYVLFALAVNQMSVPVCTIKLQTVLSKLVEISLGIMCIIIAISAISHYLDERYNSLALYYAEHQDYTNLVRTIEKTSKKEPYLINRGLAYFALYKKNKDIECLNKSEKYMRIAVKQNAFDNQAYYYLAKILERKGENAESLSIMNELVYKFPNCSRYQIHLFTLLKKSNIIKYDHLFKAIEHTPQLLHSEIWKQCLADDPKLKNRILDRMNKYIELEQDKDPIRITKYGSIYLALGDTVSGCRLIKKGLEMLPNLSHAWENLAIIESKRGNNDIAEVYNKKAALLIGGAFLSNDEKEEWRSRKLNINDYDENHVYKLKFAIWYSSRLLNVKI